MGQAPAGNGDEQGPNAAEGLPDSLPDDATIDLITGEPVKDTEKEKVRQQVIRALWREYRISLADMARDFPVPILTEDGKRRTRRADIAVFRPGSPHTADNAHRVVICKPKPKNGKVTKIRTHEQARRELEELEELMGYDLALQIEYGMWANGVDFYFLHKIPRTFGVTHEPMMSWPMADETIDSMSMLSAAKLRQGEEGDLRIDAIRQGIESSGLPDHLKQLAQQRLNLAADYVDDHARIKDLVKPGRMIIVDLRDEFIEKDEALGLFVVLMQLFAEAQSDGVRFNKLVVFDEAHKYIDSPDLVSGLVESVREMRHKGMSVLVASQDPPSVPISLIELSNHIILHKFTSPAWLKHLQKANAAFAELTPARMADLGPGEAYIWSSKATNSGFTRSALKVRTRVRITKHGGATKTAVER